MSISATVSAAGVAATQEDVMQSAQKLSATMCAKARDGCEYELQRLAIPARADANAPAWRVRVTRPAYAGANRLSVPTEPVRLLEFSPSGALVADRYEDAR